MNFQEARVSALESALQETKIALNAARLEIRMLKANDPNYKKPLSELNVNYEIVNKSNKWFCFCGSRKVNTTVGSQCPNNRCSLK
jgi:hypothetical protein